MTFLSLRPYLDPPAARQGVSRLPKIGILSTHPPTQCGLAVVSSALADGFGAIGIDVNVVRVADGSESTDSRVIGELVNGDPTSVTAAAELLNQGDLAVIQIDDGIYGGAEGDEILDIVRGLRVPSILIVHTVPKDPSAQQRSLLETLAELTDHLVVMTEAAHSQLCLGYNVDRRNVSMIPHGASPVAKDMGKRPSRPTLLTWGLLRPGKGIERVIDAMVFLRTLPGRPRYVVAGRTHPKLSAADGEAYREKLAAQVRDLGVADSVVFAPGYRSLTSLSALVQSAAAVVLPYDATDKVASGVLIDSMANGRPVVATAFPHAIELLSGGAGIVVPHDDPAELESTLHRVLTQPRLSGSMAAEARLLAPTLAWPVIAKTYLTLAQRVLAQRRALV